MTLETYVRLIVGEIICDIDYTRLDDLFELMSSKALEICDILHLAPMENDVDERLLIEQIELQVFLFTVKKGDSV